MCRRVDVGQAVGNAACRVTPRHQLPQGLRLGCVPTVLREGLTCWQAPVAVDAVSLPRGIRIRRACNVALEAQLSLRREGRRSGHDCDPYGGGCRGWRWWVSGGAAADLNVWAEVTQSAEQLARIALCQHHQARQLGVIQVAHRAKALQLQVALQQVADLGRRFNADVK